MFMMSFYTVTSTMLDKCLGSSALVDRMSKAHTAELLSANNQLSGELRRNIDLRDIMRQMLEGKTAELPDDDINAYAFSFICRQIASKTSEAYAHETFEMSDSLSDLGVAAQYLPEATFLAAPPSTFPVPTRHAMLGFWNEDQVAEAYDYLSNFDFQRGGMTRYVKPKKDAHMKRLKACVDQRSGLVAMFPGTTIRRGAGGRRISGIA